MKKFQGAKESVKSVTSSFSTFITLKIEKSKDHHSIPWLPILDHSLRRTMNELITLPTSLSSNSEANI